MSLHPDIAAVLAGDSEGCIVTGDSLLLMADMPDGCVDAVVTDPPFGIDGSSGTIGKSRAKGVYTHGLSDTEDDVRRVYVPAIREALRLSGRGAVTPGTPHAFEYPKPTDMGAILQPCSRGLGKWGCATWQPVLFYGRDPRLGLTIQPTTMTTRDRPAKCNHPCPKPLGVMLWMVKRTTTGGELVLDPFCGSGTTCVAAKKLGRRWIGIEIDEKYADIARNRVAGTPRPLFVEADTPKQADSTLFP